MLKNPSALENAIPMAVKMIQSMIKPKNPDEAVPATLIRHCRGIAFIRIFKAGLFFLGGNVGGGCMICKIKDQSQPDGYRWSAPISIACGGLGGGFIFGAEMIDSMIILTHGGAVRAFMGKGQVSFGGNVSLAVGPFGRDIEAHLAAGANRELAAAYSYSQAKGAYIGGTLEGAILMVKNEENKKFYESDLATAENCIAGKFTNIPFRAQALGAELEAVLKKKGLYAGMKQTQSVGGPMYPESEGGSMASDDLAKSGRDLVRQGFSGGNSSSSGGDLPAGWEEFKAEDGTPYYYNAQKNITQWEKPAKPVTLPPPPPKPTPAPIPPRPAVKTYKALYDYSATQSDELSFKQGEDLEIIDKSDKDWWKARSKKTMQVGLVPANYVE